MLLDVMKVLYLSFLPQKTQKNHTIIYVRGIDKE